MQKENKNVVSTILKGYAILNAIVGFFVGLAWMSDSYGAYPIVDFIFMAACIVVSFGIYAFGEVIQLLQDIKDRTHGSPQPAQSGSAQVNDELPQI